MPLDLLQPRLGLIELYRHSVLTQKKKITIIIKLYRHFPQLVISPISYQTLFGFCATRKIKATNRLLFSTINQKGCDPSKFDFL